MRARLFDEKTDRVSLFLFVGAFVYLFIWLFPININSDGLFHLSIGREIAKGGSLLTYAPHTAEAIRYPETYHVMLSLLYMWGGEELVKYFSPVCGAVIAVLVYLVLKPVSRPLGIISAVLAIGFLTHKFLNPLLEPYLLVGSLLAAYSSYLFFKTGVRKYLYLALLFVGLSVSIKQPGLIIFGAVLLVGIVVGLQRLRMGQRQVLNSVPLLAIVPLVIALAPLREQVDRIGTLYPHLSNFSYINWKGFEAVSRIAREYLLGPAFWEHPTSWVSVLLIPVLILFLLGLRYLYKKDRLLTCILGLLLIGELVITFMTNTLIRHYHVIGIAVAPIFLVSAAFYTGELVGRRIVSVSLVVLLLVLGGAGVFLYNENWWGDSGRCDDEHIGMYEQVGDFIRDNMPGESIYLAATRGFAYYSLDGTNGYHVWVPSVFASSDERKALEELDRYNVDYIFLETRQIEKENWWIDFVPSEGLMGYLDESPNFEEVYSLDGPEGDAFVLYKVVYYDYVKEKVARDIDDLSSYFLSKQVLDPDAINYGSFTGVACHTTDGPLMERYSEAPLAVLAYAWSCPESTYYQDAAVLESVRLGLLNLCNVQCWTGGFPVGSEVETDGQIDAVGVSLQDYGDASHQFFLADASLYAYGIVRDYLSQDDRQRIDTMVERVFEFLVIEPENHSNRSLDYVGLREYPQDRYFKEQVRVPREVLDSAARVDLVLRVDKVGDPEAAEWKVIVGDKTFDLDTAKINAEDVNPYREYDRDHLRISVAVWQVDDVSEILPYAEIDGDDYLLDVVFQTVDSWDADNTYSIISSPDHSVEKELTWTSLDGVTWQEWDKDLALQVWVYGNNTDLVGTRIMASNQESGRFYLVHKAMTLFDPEADALVLDIAGDAFKEEVEVFSRITSDGIFPEYNTAIMEVVGAPNNADELFYGGWSPGYGFISAYLLGLIANESGDPGVRALVQDFSQTLEYLLYEDDSGYRAMNAAATRSDCGPIMTSTDRNLFCLGFAACSRSAALETMLVDYEPLSPVYFSDNPYPLFCHQIDSMPVASIHQWLQDFVAIKPLPPERSEKYMKLFPEAKLLVVKTGERLYFVSYGNATPSGGCIADCINLVTGEHEVESNGASLDYGQPGFEVKGPIGASSAWDTQAQIEILSDAFPYKVRFSGLLRYPDQTFTLPYEVEYTFLENGLQVQRWLDREPYED